MAQNSPSRSIFGIFSLRGNGAPKGNAPEDKLILALKSFINREDLASAEIFEYEKARNIASGQARELAYVKVFFLFERFVLKNKPLVVKREFTKDSLHKELGRVISPETLPPLLRLIFSPKKERFLILFEECAKPICRYMIETLGEDAMSKILRTVPVFSSSGATAILGGEVNFDAFNRSILSLAEVTEVKVFEVFRVFYHDLFETVSRAFGLRIARNLFVKAFEIVRLNYDYDTVSDLLEAMPREVAEESRLTFLSREELEEKVLERTQELEKEKERVEGRVRERTRELEEERGKLSIIAEQMRSGVILSDIEARPLLINVATRRFLSLSEGASHDEVLLALSVAFHGLNIKECYKKIPVVGAFEIKEIKHADKIFSLFFSRINDTNGIPRFYLIWIDDVTESVNLEARRTAFVSLVTHQLRTPLAGLKWTLNMLINEELGPLVNEQKTFLMKSYENNERLIALADEMLDMSRLEATKGASVGSEIEIPDLFDNVLFEIVPSAKKRNITISLRRLTSSPLKVFADSSRIRAVMQNLIENAVKYTPLGGVVEIIVYTEDGFIVSSVRDSGIGIPEEDRPFIFSQFYRAKNAKAVDPSGSGLGLFIAKSIIETCGGKLWFDTEVGKGTTFHFKIPSLESYKAIHGEAKNNTGN